MVICTTRPSKLVHISDNIAVYPVFQTTGYDQNAKIKGSKCDI